MGADLDACPKAERAALFVTALRQLIAECGLSGLRMSEAGIERADLPGLARIARETMGGLFKLDRYRLSFDETVEILERSYR